MEQTLVEILPNLSVGVVSVVALVYVTVKFLEQLDIRSKLHNEVMSERERALREVEREVRTTVLEQISLNTQAMNDTAKVLDRVAALLDKKYVP